MKTKDTPKKKYVLKHPDSNLYWGEYLPYGGTIRVMGWVSWNEEPGLEGLNAKKEIIESKFAPTPANFTNVTKMVANMGEVLEMDESE